MDLPLREDLRTRLGWGHVFALQPLAEAEMRAALRREADRRGVFLSDEVMDYLLTRFERNLKPLMAQLDRLDRFSLANQRAITVLGLEPTLAAGYKAALNEQRLALPLFDSARWAAEFQDLLERMWARWCEGLAPEHLLAPTTA